MDRRPPTGVTRIERRGWEPDDTRRPGLPWIGIFLLVFGALLLLERLVPQFRIAGSGFLLAVGLVFLARWALERGVGSLYAGALITALAAPGLLEGLGIASGNGVGTLCLGIAFLAIAAVRSRGRGWGWQAWVGLVLVLIGGAAVALPGLGSLLLPALLVVFGLLMVFGGSGAARRWGR